MAHANADNPPSPASMNRPAYEPWLAEARRINQSTPVALAMVYPDAVFHRDGTIDVSPFFEPRAGYTEAYQVGTDSMCEGGVRLAVLSCGVNEPSIFPGELGTEVAVRNFQSLLAAIETRPDQWFVIRDGKDLDRLSRPGPMGALLHITGTDPLNDSIEQLHQFHGKLGIRAMHPFLNDAKFGGHAGGDPHAGLSAKGATLVREIQKLPMVFDVTHANDRTFEDVIRVVTGPIIDSHTNCRALCDVERNRTDEQLRRIAECGGVAGIHFSSAFIDGTRNPHRARLVAELRERIKQWREQYPNPYEFMVHRWDPITSSRAIGGLLDDGVPIPRASLQSLANHVEHMVEVMGIDHVGIGTDYANGDGCAGVVQARDLPNLTAELLRRGWSQDELRKFLGENFIRVFKQVLGATR